MVLRFRNFILCLISLFLIRSEMNAKEVITRPKQTVKFYWENDVFLFTDREYTNGIRAEYGVYKTLWTPTGMIFKAFEAFLIPNGSIKQEYSGFGVTQAIYTPTNFFSSDISYGERPYSAFGIVSSLNTITFAKSSITFEIELGQIGPNAQGKPIQEAIHSLTNSPLPQGWDKQLSNRLLYQTNFDYKYFWTKNIGSQSSVRIGNLDSSFRIGPILRLGQIYSPVTPSLGSLDSSPVYATSEREFYFFFHPSIKYQTVNATLGGNQSTTLPNTYTLSNGEVSFSQDGKVFFLGEPFYNSLVEERSSSALIRFLLFQQYLGQERALSLNYLIFNSIFNGAPVPDLAFKITVLQEVFWSDFKKENYPGIEFFVYDTLFRDPTQGASIFTKLLAYQFFFRNAVPQSDAALITVLLLYNEDNATKSYRVDLQRWQGKISTGFFYQNDLFFSKFGIEVASLEYKVEDGTIPFHRYTSIQLGTFF